MRSIPTLPSKAIRARLGELLPKSEYGASQLDDAIRYSCLGESKLVRPTLCLLAHEAAGNANPELCLDAACAIEMVHCASLILDDLPSMDDARTRRGQVTTHIKYGVDTAILAAIGLLNRAFEVVAQSKQGTPQIKVEIIAALNAAIGSNGLIAGQEMDLELLNGQMPNADIATVNWLKTGVLFAASAEIGCLAAEASADVRDAMRRFAGQIGNAFQTVDDLIDKVEDPALAGKDVQKDLGKATLARTAGVEASKSTARRQIDLALSELEMGDIDGSAMQIFVSRVFSRYIDG